MKNSGKKHLFHFILTLMLATGFVLPLMGLLNLLPYWKISLLSVLCVSFFMECISFSKKTAVVSSVTSFVLCFIWLFILKGIQTINDVIIAVVLKINGAGSALSLVASSSVLLLSIPVSILCFFITFRKACAWPSLILCSAILLSIWLTDRPNLLVYLLPAVTASLMMSLFDRYDELSFIRILIWAACIVVSAFLLTPSEGAFIPSWKNKADGFRQNIIDRFFYTEPRDVFSLSSEGFYPNGISQLGGSVSPSDHPVLQVSAVRNVYLRGVTMNEYTGRFWKNTLSGRRYLWLSRSSEKKRCELFDSAFPHESFENSLTKPYIVSVRLLSDNASTLFTPQRVRDLNTGGELIPYFSDSSELFITRNLRTGDTYSVTAPLFVGGDSGLGILVDASSGTDDPQWGSVKNVYTELPNHLEAPLWQLAAECTDNIDSPYNKAFAIQSFLRSNYRYSTEVTDLPADMDFVTGFLLQTKEGYCTYFASAMTVLCRMAGLPARYVEGYLAEPDASGEALVTGLHAHAWTEVYFKGFGWITFDATPRSRQEESPDSPSAQSKPSELSSDSDPEPSEDTDSSSDPPVQEETTDQDTVSPEQPETDHSDNSDAQNHPIRSSFFWWLLLIIALLLLIILRCVYSSPTFQDKRASTPEKRFHVWAQEVTDLLACLKIFRNTGEPILTYTHRIDSDYSLSVSLVPFGEILSKALYCSDPVNDQAVDILRDTAIVLKADLTASQKVIYMLRRLFIPISIRAYTSCGPHSGQVK